MCGSMVDIQSPTAEIRRGKNEDRKKKPQGKNIMSASATHVGLNKRKLKAKTEMVRRNGPVKKSVESVLSPERSLWWKKFVKEVGFEAGENE